MHSQKTFGMSLGTIYFVGHDVLLELLHAELCEKRFVVLAGLPGIGKSTLVTEYANRQRNLYPNAVIRINGTSHQTIQQDLATIQKRSSPSSLLFLNGKGVLLLVEHVSDPDILSFLLPVAKDRWKGHAILLTRSLLDTPFPTFVVPPLSIEESTLFLLRRTQSIPREASLDAAKEDERKDACALAELLSGYPLALEQAAEKFTVGFAFEFSLYQQYLYRILSEPVKFSESNASLVSRIEEMVRLFSPQSQSSLRALLVSKGDPAWSNPPEEIRRRLLVEPCPDDPQRYRMHPLLKLILSNSLNL